MRRLLLTCFFLPLLALAQTKVPTNVQIHVAGQGRLGTCPVSRPSPLIRRIPTAWWLGLFWITSTSVRTRERADPRPVEARMVCLVTRAWWQGPRRFLCPPEQSRWAGLGDGGALDRIVVQHSKAGKGVRNGTRAPAGLNGAKDQDKEWLAVSPSGDRLAICWTEFDHYGGGGDGQHAHPV